MAELTCGTCKHWRDTGPYVTNLTGKHFGRCLGGPPKEFITPKGIILRYPMPPDDFEACALYVPRESMKIKETM